MRHFASIMIFTLAAVPALLAQSWEVGLAGSGSFYTSQTLQNPAGNGTVGLANGFGASGWLANNLNNLVGGELRYDYEHSDLRLASAGTTVNFGGMTNAIHYDFLLHFAPSEAHVRPFIAAGAGAKFFSGTGTEQPYQPLSNLALLTKGTQFEPVVSVGGGLKVGLTKSTMLRLEVHDYLSPFPASVITPAQGSKIGGWLQDFVVSAGLSFGI